MPIRARLLAALLLALVVSAMPALRQPVAAAGRCFPETRKCADGAFYDYWLANGGLRQQGYPSTNEFAEVNPTNGQTYAVQYFERARFEYHPEFAGTPNEVLLGLLGREQYLAKYPNGRPPGGTGDVCFDVTGRCIRGAFYRYWQQHGGLRQQGYPLSDEFDEVNPTNGQTYRVQYFERARFEYHPEFAGGENEVLLGLLGREQLLAKYPNGSPTGGEGTAPLGYLALGDSYAFGIGASNPFTLGYAGHFASFLRTQTTGSFRNENLAEPGATSAAFIGDYATRGRAGQGQLARAVNLLSQGQFNVVTLGIGGNDVLRLLRAGEPCAGEAIASDACLTAAQQALTVTAGNLSLILTTLVDTAPAGTQVFVLTYPNPYSLGTNSLVEQRTDLVLTVLNDLITSAATQARPTATARRVTLTTVDLFPLFARQGGTLTHILDPQPDVHPTDAGHAVIAAALERAYQRQPRAVRAPTVFPSSRPFASGMRALDDTPFAA